jgi:steroid delta-isomerase-like uncharacterized protein
MGTDADVIRRLSDEVFVKGDLAVFDQLVAADFVSHDPPPGAPGNRDGLRGVAEMVTKAFRDRKLEYDQFIPTTDGRVVENWLMSATHTGEAFGLPASGQSVRIRGVEIWRCRDGKIVEHWAAIDMSDVAQKAMAS